MITDKQQRLLESLRLASNKSSRPSKWTTFEEVAIYSKDEIGLEDLEALYKQKLIERRFVGQHLLPYKWRETLWWFRPLEEE